MKKFSLILIFFIIFLAPIFIFSFPAKAGAAKDCSQAHYDDLYKECDCGSGSKRVEATIDWDGWKVEGICEARIWKAPCHTKCEQVLKCVQVSTDEDGNPVCQWERAGESRCKESWCDNKGEVKQRCAPWETAAARNVHCDDEKCWIESWTALEEGNCEQSFDEKHMPTKFQAEEIGCRCWGQCLAPVTDYHYYDGKEELYWGKDCDSFSENWQKEKCKKINGEGIKLPVTLSWKMPTMKSNDPDYRDIIHYYPTSQTPQTEDNYGTPNYHKGGYWLNSYLKGYTNDQHRDSDIESLIIKIGDKERFLTADELLNVTKFEDEIQKNIEPKREKLEDLKGKCLLGIYPTNFRDFLKKWNPSVEISSLLDQRRNYIDKICLNKDSQRLDQLLYFIYFTEGGYIDKDKGKSIDAVGKAIGEKETFNYSISQDKNDKNFGGPCHLKSNKGYEWSVRLCCKRDQTNCGPPSKVKEPPETSKPYPVNSNKQFFKTSPAPEPVAILESTINNWREPGNEKLSDHFTASSIRWIDTDWNGEKRINLEEGNYVDFDWCSVTTTKEIVENGDQRYFASGPPYYKLRAFYDSYIEFFRTDADLEIARRDIAVSERLVQKCEDPNKEAYCKQTATTDPKKYKNRLCLCLPRPTGVDPFGTQYTRYCTAGKIPSEVCLPYFAMLGEPRLRWDIQKFFGENTTIDDIEKMKDQNPAELIWRSENLVESYCKGSIGLPSYSMRLASNEANIIIEDPYLPLEYGNGIEYKEEKIGGLIDIKPGQWWNILNKPLPQNLGKPWQWDYQSLIFPYSGPYYETISWQVGAITNDFGDIENMQPLYSQKWNFAITKSPEKLSSWDKKNDQPIPITPISHIEAIPATEKIKDSSGTLVLNRLQTLLWDLIPRSLSYKITFYDPSSVPPALPLPEQFSIVRMAEREESFYAATKLNQAWPSLLKGSASSCSDTNCKRLDQEFGLYIEPCWDEWGFLCEASLALKQPFKITGAKPTNLTPHSDEKKKIPRYLDWDDVAGAASYQYQIKGPTSLKGIVPLESSVWADLKGDGKYTWTVRACADECDKESMLQCGATSSEASFYGCELNPPKDFAPGIGQQFSLEEAKSIKLSWGKVYCRGEEVPYYQYKVEYFAPLDCQTVKKDLRQQCEDIQKNPDCQKPKEIVPLTVISQNSVTLPPLNCLGDYHWSMRACLETDSTGKCKEEESGGWSPFGHFYVVLEKSPPLPQGGSTIGTCHDLIPCQWGSCHFSDIPKLIENIINCILWTLFPIGFFGLIVYSGLVFYLSYLSQGNLEPPKKVKSTWKMAGKGFLIMFLAWAILNFIFTFLGWRKEIFGDWFNPL